MRSSINGRTELCGTLYLSRQSRGMSRALLLWGSQWCSLIPRPGRGPVLAGPRDVFAEIWQGISAKSPCPPLSHGKVFLPYGSRWWRKPPEREFFWICHCFCRNFSCRCIPLRPDFSLCLASFFVCSLFSIHSFFFRLKNKAVESKRSSRPFVASAPFHFVKSQSCPLQRMQLAWEP